MTNANIQIAQSSATLKTAGTLAGLWCLCVFCCFSSSAASIASVIRGLQSVPGKISESIDNLPIAYMKLYKECEDTDSVKGFEAKLITLSDDAVGSIKTEDGVTIKKVKFENVGFKMSFVAVHEDGLEASHDMEVGSYSGKGEMLLGDCPRPLTEEEEKHGKVMFIKDVNIEWWRPTDGLAVQEEIKDLDSEIFSIDSEIRMYEQCNSNSKIIASETMNIGQALSSELTLERNSINNTTFRDGTLANEKVRRIEVKNVEILPGSKWTVVNDGRETTVILDYAQGYMGNETQVLDVGYVEKDEYGVGKCSDNAESYIRDINLIYIPIKLDVKEKNEVEGYRI
jgi:hypothetical protein